MMYATGTAPTYLAERTIRAQETWFSEDEHRFKDWPEGNLHHQFVQEGMFSDPRHDALMLSADGTKVVEKRNVNAWVILLSSMNSPPGERFRRKETFVSTIIPGPRNPIDMDSFLWPVMEESACAARGFWIWDGGKKEWFLWKAWLVAACADQPGSSKMSKMTGTTGAAACRMCKMKANYLPSKAKQQVGGYYPLRTVGKDLNKRNAQRPDEYRAQDVCSTLLRDDDTYGDDLDRLNSCLTQETLRKARRDTGVIGRPLLAFSAAFTHPFFFPSDMFHLFGMNLPQLLWQVFTNPVAGDPLQLIDDQQQLFGELVQEAASGLPSTFSSAAPRDPYRYSHSHYKMHKWSSVVYQYFLPFLFSIGAPVKVVSMIGHLISGIRLAVPDAGCTFDQLAVMQQHFFAVVRAWEDLFIRDDVELLSRSTISVHYLLHVSQCALSYGSMRVTSQARCEREISLAKRSMRSYKSPFVNMANNAVRREHLRLLNYVLQDETADDGTEQVTRHVLKVRLTTSHVDLSPRQEQQEKDLVLKLGRDGKIPNPPPPIIRRGKVLTPSGASIRGSRTESPSARQACHFAYRNADGEGYSYGRALHFICFDNGTVDSSEAAIETDDAYALFSPLVNTQIAQEIIRGTWS
ncbi:hypothetical protein CF327_g4184 [Tilletia walkeri]|nr:hypothetical protein CF327_g4184 [Tilletia walkeri]